MTVETGAAELGMTYETASTHLRHIFDKTWTSRQTELIVLLARLITAPGVEGGTHTPIRTSWLTPPAGRERSVRRS